MFGSRRVARRTGRRTARRVSRRGNALDGRRHAPRRLPGVAAWIVSRACRLLILVTRGGRLLW